MSDSAVHSLDQLPSEILLGIFQHLDIPDILRLRKVSRHLNGISHSRDVWSDAYRKATFVRPPGPFLSQSADDLEKVLVPGFRVDRNLQYGGGTMAQAERPTLKVKEIRCTGSYVNVCLVFGRFLFIAFSDEVRCHDLSLDVFDSNSGASIIYRSTEGTLKSCHCTSAIDVEGRRFACVVLNEEIHDGTRQISIFSFRVGERSDVTLDLLYQFKQSDLVHYTVDLGPRVIVLVGHSSGSDCPLVAFEVHTRTLFLLPSFTHATTDTSEVWKRSISTATHLLLAKSCYTQATGWNTVFTAFSLPPLDTVRRSTSTSTSESLSPSHHGVIPRVDATQSLLVHDSIFDPITHDILIAIRVHAFERSPFVSSSKLCILRLSAASTGTSSDHKMGIIAYQLRGFLGNAIPWLHPSFNGTGRVFHMPERSSEGISVLEYDLCVNGDEPAKLIEYKGVLRFPTPHRILDYDLYSGRICVQSSAITKYNTIIILDFAV